MKPTVPIEHQEAWWADQLRILAADLDIEAGVLINPDPDDEITSLLWVAAPTVIVDVVEERLTVLRDEADQRFSSHP